MRILANHDARGILDDYLLVGASSWSPGDHAVLASLQGLSEHPVFVGISNASDMNQYEIWKDGRGIVPLPITAGDWNDPELFSPVPHEERTTDVVMVSHFASWKRHWILFEALRHMRPDLRVVLIGRDADGRTEQSILREAHAFGVPQHLDVYKNLEIDEVAAHQCNARVAVALSRREGSCVSVTEAMFADTPVVMMNDAHIGTKRYINSETGRIASRRQLARVLSDAIDGVTTCQPRKWALENISAHSTSTKLNDILRTYCKTSGLPWTADIAPMCWRYVPSYLYAEDEKRMALAATNLRTRYGVRLKPFAGERIAHALQQRRNQAA